MSNALAALAPTLVLGLVVRAPAQSPPAAADNLARRAHATASEQQDAFAPQLALDGDPATRWSGIPGHNEGVWFELSWDAPVDVGCVVLHQYDRYVTELDLEAWDDATQTWRALGHVGHAGARLHSVILWRREMGGAAATVHTTKLRVARISNGPSFTDVDVYADPFAEPPELHASGDADGHLQGIVTDRFGAAPVAGATVELAATTPAGATTLTATTGANGTFVLAAPPGLRGPLGVRVTPSGARSFDLPPLDAAALPVALTPYDDATPHQRLHGTWRFAADPEPAAATPNWATPTGRLAESREIQVPSHLVMHGLEPTSGVAAARRLFVRPSFGRTGRMKLRFDGAYSGAEVFVNGTRCVAHEGGATPFEADLTELLRDGENVLAVRLREHTDTSDRLDRMSQYADFPLLGIWRDVTLLAVPSVHFAALRVTPRFVVDGSADASHPDATLAVAVDVVNESADPFDGEVALDLADPLGRPEALAGAVQPLRIAPWTRATLAFAPRVAAPAAWDAEHPRRHALAVTVRRGRTTVQKLTQSIGFRETTLRGAELRINGAPTKLRGTCHHDGDPLAGRAITATQARRDVELILGANLNALRTSHYPPHPALLDAADELGCYVEDEASFCWVGDANDLRLEPRIVQLTAELVARDRNHPSVFLWSLCNESEWGFDFDCSRDFVRAADPARPQGAAISATLDVATAHNPITLDRIAANEGLDRPLLFDESFCIWQGIFGDPGELWLDPGIRHAWVQPMRPIAERFFASKATQGSMIWCFADDLFCVPGRGLEFGRGVTRSHFVEPGYRQSGRGLVGDAPWGFVDGWRRLKPEYFHVRELFAPIRFGAAVMGSDGRVDVPLENRFDATNLADCVFTWTRGEDKGSATAQAPPHATAWLALPPATDGKAAPIVVEAYAPSGRLVATRRFAPAATPTAPAAADPAAPPLVLQDEGLLSGANLRVIGGGFELAFDRHSGALRRGVIAGAPALLEWPRVHVLARTEPFAPRPARDSFRLAALDATPIDGGVRLLLRGSWGDFHGSVNADVRNDGAVHLVSHVTYEGPDLDAREVGLTLALPASATTLRWSCLPEADADLVYPDDHLGRPLGVAEAFPATIGDFSRDARQGAPNWPFRLDPSPFGCNDFRSTKRCVDTAALEESTGTGVALTCGGRQHVRACVEDDRVRLCVLDFSGGTAAGAWEWESNYGRGRPLKKGDVLESTLDFRLTARVRPSR